MDADGHGCSPVNAITKSVIGAAMEVSNNLGCGFLEKVYERALAIELTERGHRVVTQTCMQVRYKDQVVGHFVADMVVDHSVLVELKCAQGLTAEHVAQCLNHLAATGRSVCLLLNFQRPRLQWKRIVHRLSEDPR